MDRPMERSNIGLIDVMMCPRRGCVVGVSTITNLGHSVNARVSLRGLPRPTPVIGLNI